MHHLRGCGLPNVQLVDGYVVREKDQSVAYQDIDGLYKAIAQTVACRGADLTGAEFRFLRKRLGMSQGDAGELVGCTDQTVAKWEKGELRVPVAAGRLLRATWLAKHARRYLAVAIDKMSRPSEYVSHGYVFSFVNGKWKDTSDQHVMGPVRAEAEQVTWDVIQAVKREAAIAVASATYSTFRSSAATA